MRLQHGPPASPGDQPIRDLYPENKYYINMKVYMHHKDHKPSELAHAFELLH